MHDLDYRKKVSKINCSIAHIGARLGTLPKDFNSWDIKDSNGVSVAHIAARYGTLPDDFEYWNLADDFGWTVAHEAAKYGTFLYMDIPNEVLENLWDLKDNNGITVAEVFNDFVNTKSQEVYSTF